eukprot:s899_g5.t1
MARRLRSDSRRPPRRRSPSLPQRRPRDGSADAGACSDYSYSYYDDVDDGYLDRRRPPRRGSRTPRPRSRRRRRPRRRGASHSPPAKPLFTDMAYRSRNDLRTYNDFCEQVGIKGRVIAKIRGMMQNMERADLDRLLDPTEVDNIRKAQNPIGMAINRIRTIERESGRAREMQDRKGSGKGRAPTPPQARSSPSPPKARRRPSRSRSRSRPSPKREAPPLPRRLRPDSGGPRPASRKPSDSRRPSRRAADRGA